MSTKLHMLNVRNLALTLALRCYFLHSPSTHLASHIQGEDNTKS